METEKGRTMNVVWNKMEERMLCYGTWDNSKSTIKALTFGILVELSEGRIENYRSDLWHDALWIEQYITGPTTFEWVVRDWGTHIGEAAAGFNYDVFGSSETVIKYRFEIEDNDGRWKIVIWEASPVRDLPNVPDTKVEDQRLIDTVFPIHGNNSNEKGNSMSYQLDRLVDELREKLDEANSTKDELEEKQSAIEDAVSELDGYIDEMERLVSSLDELPEVSIYVDLDTVSFDS